MDKVADIAIRVFGLQQDGLNRWSCIQVEQQSERVYALLVNRKLFLASSAAAPARAGPSCQAAEKHLSTMV